MYGDVSTTPSSARRTTAFSAIRNCRERKALRRIAFCNATCALNAIVSGSYKEHFVTKEMLLNSLRPYARQRVERLRKERQKLLPFVAAISDFGVNLGEAMLRSACEKGRMERQRKATESRLKEQEDELALQRAEGDLDYEAEAFLKSIAIGGKSGKESALLKLQYADALYRRSRLRSFATWPQNPAARHYVTKAETDLKRHIRSSPNDLDALEALQRAMRILGKDTTAVEERIKLVETRKSMIPDETISDSDVDLSGISFEKKCLDIIRGMGFSAEMTIATGDGGIDIIAFHDQPLLRGKYVVQCKDWSNPVGEPALRDLLGVVAAEDAVKGILLTTSTFTEAAQRFAEGKRLELIDGDELNEMARKFASSA